MPVFRPADILSKPFLVATRVKRENSTEIAEQASLWRRARVVSPYPQIERRFLLQRVQNLPDNHGVFDTRLCDKDRLFSVVKFWQDFGKPGEDIHSQHAANISYT